jgi:hypothetical protein
MHLLEYILHLTVSVYYLVSHLVFRFCTTVFFNRSVVESILLITELNWMYVFGPSFRQFLCYGERKIYV